MGYEKDNAALLQEVADAQQSARDLSAWYYFIRGQAGPNKVMGHDANFNIVLAYFAGQELSVPLLQEFINKIPGLSYETEDEEKAALIAEYLTLVGGSNEMKNAQAARLKYQETEQIRESVESLKAAKSMRGMTTQQLQQIVKPARVGPQPLPSEFTRAVIFKLPGSELKHILIRYGSDAVNRRLREKV